MKKLIFGVLAFSALFFIGGCAKSVPSDKERAVSEAQSVFQGLKEQGFVFTSGPCLSNNLLGDENPDWVADVVHVPRSVEDDDPVNQCARFRAGDATHLVELDTEGNVVRAE